jgi:hypothetical protein
MASILLGGLTLALAACDGTTTWNSTPSCENRRRWSSVAARPRAKRYEW